MHPSILDRSPAMSLMMIPSATHPTGRDGKRKLGRDRSLGESFPLLIFVACFILSLRFRFFGRFSVFDSFQVRSTLIPLSLCYTPTASPPFFFLLFCLCNRIFGFFFSVFFLLYQYPQHSVTRPPLEHASKMEGKIDDQSLLLYIQSSLFAFDASSSTL